MRDSSFYTGPQIRQEIKQQLIEINGNIAKDYSPSSSYAVGDYCIKDKALFKCNTAIPAPGEAWNAAHWDATDVADELQTKQPTLVSGTNIKKINGQSVLGSGDLLTSSLEGYYYADVFWWDSAHNNRIGNFPGKIYFDIVSEEYYVYDTASA